MVAINEILLPECTGEGCDGDNDICTDSRVHYRNAENRAPVTRNHRSAPTLGRWLSRDPIGYRGGINLYGYVNSSPVGRSDPQGESWWSIVGNFVEGAAIGVAVAAAVTVAAPEIAAVGAVALIGAGVEAATATTVASAAVTVGVGAAAIGGTVAGGASLINDYRTGNMNGAAFTVGAMAGGLAFGASGGGRALSEGISGEPSSVPPSWNPVGDWNQGYDPNYPNGSPLKWLSKSPTPQSGARVLTLIDAGIPHSPGPGRANVGC